MGTMPTTSDPMTNFRERIAEKLRADIGAMLPDDALIAMVRQAVENEFFKERTVDDGQYHTKTAPSWFVTEVTKAAEPILREMLAHYIKENRPVIEKALADFLSHETLLLMTFGALREATQQDLMTFANDIINRMQQSR